MERLAARALPRDQPPGRGADAVVEKRELHRLAAAVARPGNPDVGRIHEALVHELGQQELAVVRLPSLVREVEPTLVARWRRPGVLVAARSSEPACGVIDHGVTALREVDVVPVVGLSVLRFAGGRGGFEARLGPGESVQHHDRREGGRAA